MKRFILYFLITLFAVINTFGQSDTTIIKIHSVIGDTLESVENQRFNILSEEADSMKYAVFVIVKGEVKAILTNNDNTKTIIGYSLQKVLEDGAQVDKILSMKSDVNVAKKKENRLAKLRVIYKGRKKRIRRYGRIRLKLYDTDVSLVSGKYAESGLILAKLLKVTDAKVPSITVKLQHGTRPRVNIPLSNIKMIRFNTPTEAVLFKIISVGYLSISFLTGRAAIVRDDPGLIPISVVSGIIGLKPLLKGNKKYDIGVNSRFEIFY